MRFRDRSGRSARRFVFDRPTVSGQAEPSAAPALKAADLENPYTRYYGRPRTREDLLKNHSGF